MSGAPQFLSAELWPPSSHPKKGPPFLLTQKISGKDCWVPKAVAKYENVLAVTGSSGAEKSFLRKGWYLVSAVEMASRDGEGGRGVAALWVEEKFSDGLGEGHLETWVMRNTQNSSGEDVCSPYGTSGTSLVCHSGMTKSREDAHPRKGLGSPNRLCGPLPKG